MCTLTYIPVRNGFYLTSNRDEQQRRPAALEPRIYTGRTGALLFPRDTYAGGTWFAAQEKGTVAVLLNGAWQKHVSRPPYRRSRGLVLLDLLDQLHPLQAFQSMDLEGIEPFTVILIKEGMLHECRWDGTTRYHRTPDPALPHIWSSVTLYTPAVIRERDEGFRDWLQDHSTPSLEDVLSFHRVMMLRNESMATVSITALHQQPSGTEVLYLDVPAATTSQRNFLTPAIPPAV